MIDQIAVAGMGQLAFIDHPFMLLHPSVEGQLHPFIVLLRPFAERHLGIITGYIIAAANFDSFNSCLGIVKADHLD